MNKKERIKYYTKELKIWKRAAKDMNKLASEFIKVAKAAKKLK